MLILLSLHVDCILDNYRVPQQEVEEEERKGSDDNTTNVKRFTHKYNSQEWKIFLFILYARIWQ